MHQEITRKIEELLDRKVRPELGLHGGDLQVLRFEDGVLWVHLTGNCSNCPSAGLTVKSLVEEQVCAAFEEVKTVELQQQVSDALLQETRRILATRGKR